MLEHYEERQIIAGNEEAAKGARRLREQFGDLPFPSQSDFEPLTAPRGPSRKVRLHLRKTEPRLVLPPEEGINISNVTVLEALSDPRYKWRTPSRIARQLGIPLEDVMREIVENRDILVESSRRTEDGEHLYTTRKHYEKTTPKWRRLLADL